MSPTEVAGLITSLGVLIVGLVGALNVAAGRRDTRRAAAAAHALEEKKAEAEQALAQKKLDEEETGRRIERANEEADRAVAERDRALHSLALARQEREELRAEGEHQRGQLEEVRRNCEATLTRAVEALQLLRDAVLSEAATAAGDEAIEDIEDHLRGHELPGLGGP